MDDKLRQRRIELDLTLEQVGDICGVGKSTVRKWENGMINDIGRSKIVLLAKALKVSPLFILDLDNYDVNLTNQEKSLLTYYRKMNDIGKQKAFGNIEDLSRIYSIDVVSYDNYLYNSNNSHNLFVAEPRSEYKCEVNAAHANINASTEDIKHDEDIMNDHNF